MNHRLTKRERVQLMRDPVGSGKRMPGDLMDQLLPRLTD